MEFNLTKTQPGNMRRFDQLNVHLSTTVTWLCIALVLIIFMSSGHPENTGMALLLICIASIHSMIMQFIPWDRVNSNLMFRLWVLVEIILLACAIPISGGINSKMVYIFIPILVMACASYKIWQTYLLSILVSIIYSLEIVFFTPQLPYQFLLQHLMGTIPLFFIVNIIAAFTISEVKNQTRKRESYENLAKEFYTLFETARTVNTLSSLPEILDYSCHQLRKISGNDIVFIALRNDNEHTFKIKSICGENLRTKLLDHNIDIHEGSAKLAFTQKKSVQVYDAQSDPICKLDNILFLNIKSLLAVPIIYRNNVYGIIYIFSTLQHIIYTEHKINLIDALANIIGIAAENMSLVDSLNHQVQNLTDLMDVASAVQGSLKQDEILHAIVEKSYQRFSAHTCQINLIHKEENWLEIAAFKGFTPKITGRINNNAVYRYTSRCPVLLGEKSCIYTERDGCPRFHSHDSIKSYICAPLKVGNEIFGVIHLTSLQEDIFSPDDLTFLSSFAKEAGLAVQRGRLYEELAIEKAKIETIIKSIDDPIIVLDASGGLVMANDAFYFYFNISAAQEQGKSFGILMNESPYVITIESHDYLSLVNSIYKSAQSLIVTCTITSFNNTYYNHITLTPILNVRREVTGIVALFHDVSELQELLQRLNQEKENAEQANLLKTEFLANISHELRTPLNSIIGYTQCILDGVDGEVNCEQHNDLKRVLNNAENLLRLINDILDLSKLELNHTEIFYENIEIPHLVNEVVKTIKPLADTRGLVINTELAPILKIRSDSFRLQQVLINLLSNAVKFTHIGHITIATDIKLVDGYLTFLISDTGIGINEQAQEYIFDRFRQADGSITRKYGGTGLGLSICKNLVQLLGGTIWASSEPGLGSTFYFTLPLAQPNNK